MPRKKRQANRKNKNKKKTEESLSWVVTGIVLILVAILALLRFGWLGKELANLLRLLIGDSYLLGGAFLAILGLVMLIYGQPPRFGFKRTSGLTSSLSRQESVSFSRLLGSFFCCFLYSEYFSFSWPAPSLLCWIKERLIF